MVNRTSNRVARRILGPRVGVMVALSNRRRRIIREDHFCPSVFFVDEYKKPSRRQKRARRNAELDVWANLHRS